MSQKMLQKEPLNARTLVMDLFATRADAMHSLATLCRAGAAFGITDAAIRTALVRLSREGKVTSGGRGLYRAVPDSDAMRDRIFGWRDALSRQRPNWSGQWVLVIAGPRTRVDRTVWRRSMSAMQLEGLRQVDADVWVRPDNLVGGVAEVRHRMHALGASRELLIARLDEVELASSSKWIALWDFTSQQRTLVELSRRLAASARRLHGCTDESAAVETLMLGREAVRAILRDPLLPAEVSSSQALRDLIQEMDRYDRLGKEIWARWLGIGSSISSQAAEPRRARSPRRGQRD